MFFFYTISVQVIAKLSILKRNIIGVVTVGLTVLIYCV